MKQIIFFFILITLSSCNVKQRVDLIIYNAIVYTVDEKFSIAESFAINNGKIIKVGGNQEILNYYTSFKKVDAKKSPIYPGFIDAHCHFYHYGLNKNRVDLVETNSFTEVIEKIVLYNENNSSNWIIGSGWDQSKWDNKNFPDNSKLDSLFPKNPVLLWRIDGHAALVNSKALELANITTKTNVDGGKIIIENNSLTGILIDNAINLVSNLIPKPSVNEQVKALLSAQKECFQFGLTTVNDAGLDFNIVQTIDSLQKNNVLKMKIYAMLNDNKTNKTHYFRNGPYRTNRLNVSSFKAFADGAMGSRGACLLEEYSDKKNHFGFLLNTKKHFEKIAEQCLKNNFQLNVHCIGDSSLRLILNIMSNKLSKNNDKRWRIEHAQLFHPFDLQKIKEYNIIPSMQPTHATSDMIWIHDRLGIDRAQYAYALKTLKSYSGIIALGTDFPVEKINPFLTFYASVARKNAKGIPENGFQIENALSRIETLKGMTIWAAYSNFEENEKGSIQEGKYADFIILDNDIMQIKEEEILNTNVLKTYINGEIVYNKTTAK